MKYSRLLSGGRAQRAPRKKRVAAVSTVVEVQSGFVLGARLSKTGRHVSRVSVREFSPEALSADSCLAEIAKPEELAEMLRGVEAGLGGGKGPVGLLIPDPLVRVGILEFETLPSDARERDSLIEWKLKPLLPFAVEDARLSSEVLHQEEGRVEVLALAARKAALAEYESIVEPFGGEIGLVLPATLALLPLLDENAELGELLLHVWPGGLTAVVVGAGRLRLWRSQSRQWASPAECLQAASEETARILASAQDRLQLEIGRVCLCARPPAPREWVQDLGAAVSREIEILGTDPSYAAGLSGDEGELLRYFGAPLAGLLANAA